MSRAHRPIDESSATQVPTPESLRHLQQPCITSHEASGAQQARLVLDPALASNRPGQAGPVVRRPQHAQSTVSALPHAGIVATHWPNGRRGPKGPKGRRCCRMAPRSTDTVFPCCSRPPYRRCKPAWHGALSDRMCCWTRCFMSLLSRKTASWCTVAACRVRTLPRPQVPPPAPMGSRRHRTLAAHS